MAKLVQDSEKCTACHVCEMVCSFKRTGEFNMKRSALHLKEDTLLRSVTVCQQCKNAPCIKACKEKALIRYEDYIKLDAEKCTGCGDCLAACPFKAIFKDTYSNLVTKCDLCEGNPLCVEYCQKSALSVK
ncbi:MAG TPA: 4Fe-4S dicluster domain-containing protein [Clostridia bacterium]|nr:4Fe-4S dicluster domain-containing protein [Clostridia bacterium]